MLTVVRATVVKATVVKTTVVKTTAVRTTAITTPIARTTENMLEKKVDWVTYELKPKLFKEKLNEWEIVRTKMLETTSLDVKPF